MSRLQEGSSHLHQATDPILPSLGLMLPTPGFAQLRSPGFKWTGISPYFCFSLSLPLRPIDHSLSPSEFFSGWSPRSLCLKSGLRCFPWLDKESKVGERERERVRCVVG